MTVLLHRSSTNVARPAKHYRDGFLSWPVLGLATALMCTVAWCAFLVWLMV